MPPMPVRPRPLDLLLRSPDVLRSREPRLRHPLPSGERCVRFVTGCSTHCWKNTVVRIHLRDCSFGSAHAANSHGKLCTPRWLEMVCEQPSCGCQRAPGRREAEPQRSRLPQQPPRMAAAHLHSAYPAGSGARGRVRESAHTKFNTYGTLGKIRPVASERETHNHLVLPIRTLTTPS
ncbi:uncharacterized protein LOC119697595 [Motacilla alba alba]|uniref:uncharacterized protein LOC119697595 n=1 Tax=Motacilla alba alba TaxID=1094192 RepID=UPI0018D59F65|nr:uncharacterized protein LOC119697595 [Motacilla alba alba]